MIHFAQSKHPPLCIRTLFVVMYNVTQWRSLDPSTGAFSWRPGQQTAPALWGAGASLHPILNSSRWGRNRFMSDAVSNHQSVVVAVTDELIDSARGTHKVPSPIPTPTWRATPRCTAGWRPTRANRSSSSNVHNLLLFRTFDWRTSAASAPIHPPLSSLFLQGDCGAAACRLLD